MIMILYDNDTIVYIYIYIYTIVSLNLYGNILI